VYLHATLKLSYAGVGKFLAMAPRLKALVEADGWVLVNALLLQTGRFNTVIHIWRVRDMNHYHETIEKLKRHPDFDYIIGVLAESVVEETLAFAERTAYAPA
jgi:hypothetical protein